MSLTVRNGITTIAFTVPGPQEPEAVFVVPRELYAGKYDQEIAASSTRLYLALCSFAPAIDVSFAVPFNEVCYRASINLHQGHLGLTQLTRLGMAIVTRASSGFKPYTFTLTPSGRWYPAPFVHHFSRDPRIALIHLDGPDTPGNYRLVSADEHLGFHQGAGSDAEEQSS